MFKTKYIFLTIITILFLTINVYGIGDGNIDGGGGNLGGGTSSNKWRNGDEGVRVTVVDATSGNPITTPIDFTNKKPTDIRFHFGKVSKKSYNNGMTLSILEYNYTFYNPKVPLPKIISNSSSGNNIEAIKKYFCDKGTIQFIAERTGITYENLTSGQYKVLLEPIAYVTFKGKRVAFTATECALYDQKLNGGIRSKLVDFSHKNLPLSMFLEKDDLGYTAWEGKKNQRVKNEQIIDRLGLGIVKFKEEPEEEKPEIKTFDYIYRTDTDVITSIEVSGGEANPDQPINVYFEILENKYKVENVFYPDGEKQLAWVKWHTPKKPQELEIKVILEKHSPPKKPDPCTGEGGEAGSISTTEKMIKVKIEEIIEKTPPNPIADDRNDSYDYSKLSENVPKYEEVIKREWSIWKATWIPKIEDYICYDKCEDGYVDVRYEDIYDSEGNKIGEDKIETEYPCKHGYTSPHTVERKIKVDNGSWSYEKEDYYAELEPKINIKPDSKNPTAKGKEMKSGYGINEEIDCKIKTNNKDNITPIQNGVSFFPEFYYKDYFRLLEVTNKNKLEFRSNKYSTFKNRTHFTPIWYPDERYEVYSTIFDAWTPAGMLYKNESDYVEIKGDLWKDWHIAPLKP